MNAESERCPWCGSLISHSRFIEIQSRIREQEQKRLADAQAATRKQVEQKFLRDLEIQKRAAEKNAKEEAQKEIAKADAEKQAALEKLKLSEAREAALAKQAEERASQRVKAALEQTERHRQKELAEQRAILEKARDQEILKKQAEFNREREAMQRKILEMDRQLQKKTANEIGDGAEIDLFELLREAFPGDHITRTPKGQSGADILEEVFYKGVSCGRIIIDSKNRQAWQNTFVAKLRQDQTEAKADHAILSTTVFPSGKKELSIESDVILVHPARALYIVKLLRQAMVVMHVRGLTMKERAGKMSQLYRFITSEAYAQRLREASKLTEDILELDVQEKKTHDGVWRKRGALATRLGNILREVDTEISAIVESAVGNEVPAA